MVVLALVSGHAFAQAPDAPRRAPAISLREAAILGIAATGAASLLGFDERIGSWTRASSFQRSPGMRATMDGANMFGDPGTVFLGAALWAGGELSGDHATATDGVRALEAVALGSTVTFLVKGIAGRARPHESPTDARDFRWGRGFSAGGDYQSFPSGHTTAAFAFASAITARVGRRAPERARWLGPVLYGAAALTGFARMYKDAHWASDIVLGAGIGTVSGLLLVRHLDGRSGAP